MPCWRVRILFGALAAIVISAAIARLTLAQDMPASATAPPPAAPTPTQATAPAPAAPAAQPLSQAQFDQLIAPVALYPDPLLSQILMASTYPLEVVEAARWVAVPANQKLTGDGLTEALKAENLDPSVMALVPFPRVLETMNNQLDWTQKLGNAFLAQQADVMEAVQRLRHAALAAGNLKATPECHCTIKISGDIVSILPAEPKFVCVPVYSPRVVYGAWRDEAYPPYGFPVPAGFAYAPGVWIGFEPPIELAVYGPLWGWGAIDWSTRRIAVDLAVYNRFAPNHPVFADGNWVHDPAHRRGVAYADPAVRGRFGAAARAAAIAQARTNPGISAGRFAGTAAPFGEARHVPVGGSEMARHAIAPGGAGRRGPGALHAGAIGGGPRHVAQARFGFGGPRGGGFARGPARGAAPHFAPAHLSSGGPHAGGPARGGGPHGADDHHH